MNNSFARFLNSHAAQHFAEILSHSPHPTCKIQMFLKLRVLSRTLCVCATRLLPGRLICLAKHSLPGVQRWTKHVIESGWIYQIWPTTQLLPKVWVGRQSCEKHWRARLKYDPKLGLPRFMRQEYFDEVCKEQRSGSKGVLGWSYGRDRENNLYCNLCL